MEKMMRQGVEALSEEELAAILIGSGTRRENALELASRVLRTGPRHSWLLQASPEELMMLSGIGQTKACRLLAGLALGKRLTEARDFYAISLDRPQAIAHYLQNYFSRTEKEHFCEILLDVHLRPIRTVLISVGSMTEAHVHPREVFQPALRIGCTGIVLAHNHPSGNPEPSPEDIHLTKRLQEAGELLGVTVLDHIVVGSGDRFVSFKMRNFL